MKRRALIIYCDNTSSGELSGPSYDNHHYRIFLQSKLGGDWFDNEILSLNNPSSSLVNRAVNEFLNGADFTFIIFSGHGFLNTDENNRQYLEVADKDISILSLRTTARRQSLIIDACRGYYSPTREMLKCFSDAFESLTGEPYSTRQMYENAVMAAEEGWTILYAASENESALDTDNGGAYLLSLLRIAENWEATDRKYNILGLDVAHEFAKRYLSENFDTIQVPSKNGEKRLHYFPFAVKRTPLYG